MEHDQSTKNEHLHPTFTGNTATKYGKDNEEKAIQLMEGQGHTVEKKGQVVCPDHPWFGASPEGILDSAQQRDTTVGKRVCDPFSMGLQTLSGEKKSNFALILKGSECMLFILTQPPVGNH